MYICKHVIVHVNIYVCKHEGAYVDLYIRLHEYAMSVNVDIHVYDSICIYMYAYVIPMYVL